MGVPFQIFSKKFSCIFLIKKALLPLNKGQGKTSPLTLIKRDVHPALHNSANFHKGEFLDFFKNKGSDKKKLSPYFKKQSFSNQIFAFLFFLNRINSQYSH